MRLKGGRLADLHQPAPHQIQPLVANSPFMGWLYQFLSVNVFSALLGVVEVSAALLLAMPYARPEASWLAGVTGAVVGLVLGFGMHRLDSPEV